MGCNLLKDNKSSKNSLYKLLDLRDEEGDHIREKFSDISKNINTFLKNFSEEIKPLNDNLTKLISAVKNRETTPSLLGDLFYQFDLMWYPFELLEVKTMRDLFLDFEPLFDELIEKK